MVCTTPKPRYNDPFNNKIPAIKILTLSTSVVHRACFNHELHNMIKNCIKGNMMAYSTKTIHFQRTAPKAVVIPKVLSGPAMPNPSTPCRRATPEIALQPFQGRPPTRWLSCGHLTTTLATPSPTPLLRPYPSSPVSSSPMSITALPMPSFMVNSMNRGTMLKNNITN
jgi:hypothetical protein